MSYDVCQDVADLLEDEGFGVCGVDIWTMVQYRLTGELRGILVETTSPGDIPDALIQTDVIPVAVTVCKGDGDQGRSDTGNLSYQIFKALDLKTDFTVNGTDYLCIKATTSPYEMERDGRYYRVMRFEVTRYYGGTN